ncbi:MAG: hypothetical protein KDC48_16635, partial [Planctomycetes bacterium]|nr:hypothetical protein [Planctomycetota bacterium]
MLRALCPLFLATVVVCQDAAERCAAALLRGDVEAAAEAATSATDPAERARLQAAVLPPSQRPLAMLMVAARHRDNAQADHAILAGAAAVMVQRGRGESLPGLRRWCVIEDQDDDGAEIVPAPVVVGLWRELEYRRAHGGDLGTLAEAEQLLRFASVSRFGFEPARVLPEQPLSLPERREELLLRAWRRQPGRGGWHELAQLGPADREVLLATDSNAPIPALPAGDWLVELASTATCWRGVRAVEVSDLDVVALADGAGVALGAWRGGQVAGTGQWWFRSGSGERVGGACARGAQVFPRRETGLAGAGELFVQVDGQRALVPLGNGRFGWDNHERWQAHLMVDRPIYRPGDTVMGRLVLREATYEGELLDAVVHTKPAADCEVELRALDEGDRVTLRGRTDAAGVWTFAVPLPEVVATGDMPFEVRTVADGRRIYSGYPGAVAMFRRASLLLDVTGPEQVAAAEDASVELHARWASGAPASAIVAVAKVELRARGRSFPDERHELATDADGKITLQLPLHRLGAKWVHVTFDVHTPQGPKELRHRIQVMQPSSDDDDAPGPRYLTLVPPEIAVVGAPCVVRVQGPADGHALFVAGRGRGARAFQLQFDGAGEASVTVVPTREEWPALDLAVADAENRCSRRVPMLQRAAVAPQITLPERTRPGSAVECRIATGVAGTVVTVAVVDERVFAIAPDRTPEPGAELRPPVHYPQWERTTSAPAMTGAELLGSMLVDGRVPESWYGGSLDRSGGPAGGAGAASPAVGDVRTEFRATAAFVTVVAGPDGVAVAPFTLPDDLTTWRVTLVGVAPDGAAFLERRQVQTRLPLAAEPVLPRVLRAGDTVQMPIAVDRAAGAGSGENVALAATCTGAAAAIEHGEHELAVAGGSAATVPVTLRGAAAGAAELEFAATLGELVDRSRRTLVVSPDAVARPVSAAAMGEGEVGVECPAELAAGAGVDVEVLGGSSA